MVAVRIFVILTKNYMTKEKISKNKKVRQYNKGEIPFGLEVVLFVLAIFIIWILMGGAKKKTPENMLLTPESGQIVPKGAF